MPRSKGHFFQVHIVDGYKSLIVQELPSTAAAVASSAMLLLTGAAAEWKRCRGVFG
jgi:hypothetical protein